MSAIDMALNARGMRKKACQIREWVVNVAVENNAGHIAPSLSCVDILVALYYNSMSHKPGNSMWDDRDRLIFSKAHGCYALYAILADLGNMPKSEWAKFYTCRSTLSGCAERRPEYGVEASCGSLGHGLPIAAGVAFGAKLRKKKYHTFCLIGDGEMQEGTTWEAIQFAVKYQLNNLTIIIDENRLQAMDFVVNIMDTGREDKIRRLKGFGLSPKICPGHDVVNLAGAMRSSRNRSGIVPKVIVAKTTKGFGLKCMENIPKFHFRIPTKEEMCLGRNHGHGY
jgi:transketolase